MSPYFQDERVTLYHGRAEHILPHLGTFDAVITDPPYGETSLEWDRWPENWPTLAAVAPQLWCFGSFRMFMDRGREFAQWKLAQDIVWEKHNGSNSSNDRFRRVHELAAHFYRGEWSGLYLDPQYTQDATAHTVRRKARPPQWGDIGESSYASEDGGPRLMTSVIYARSCHGHAVNETQKPEALVAPLVAYSVPPRRGSARLLRRQRHDACRRWKARTPGCRDRNARGAMRTHRRATQPAGVDRMSAEYPRGRTSQQVLKAEGHGPDATDRERSANASPDGGPMGAEQPAAAGLDGAKAA